MTPHILFLISPHPSSRPARSDNALTLPAAFRRAGWQVSEALHRNIHRTPRGLACSGTLLGEYSLIWPIGFGPRAGFLDWVQLLHGLAPRRLINPAAAMLLQHGKAAWSERQAVSHIAADSATLVDAMLHETGDWVLKPLAGSYGEGVIRIAANATARVHEVMAQHPSEYFVLQRFLPEIAQGETRTLVAGGEIIGSYLRVPDDELHANLARQAKATATTLSAEQRVLVNDIRADLLQQHIGFAAIDTVGTTLMEVNVANPGGLSTLNAVYTRDFGAAIVAATTAFIVGSK